MNVVIVSGRIDSDVRDSTTKTGKRLVSFSLKTSESFKGTEFSSWHQVQAWGETANSALEFTRGRWVVVTGKLGGHKEGEKWRTCVVGQKIESFEAPGPSIPEPDHNDANEDAPW